MTGGRLWTEEEENRLCEMWGHYSIDSIARKLGRSVAAIRVRVNRLDLPPFLECGEYITLNQLMLHIRGTKNCKYQTKSWVENRGMPVHMKARSSRCRIKIVYMHEFWKWAEKNREFINFSKLEPGVLGKEPKWLQEQRKKDQLMNIRARNEDWTKLEDERLIHLLKEHKYTCLEISKLMNRSAGAIEHRCRRLNLMERPVPIYTKEQGAVWTEKMLTILADGIRNGCSYTELGDMIGKSGKAVRTRVYSTYYTEKLDVVRAMLRDGAWGDNRPVAIVRQAMTISEFRSGIKRDIRKMAGILKHLEEMKKGVCGG